MLQPLFPLTGNTVYEGCPESESSIFCFHHARRTREERTDRCDRQALNPGSQGLFLVPEEMLPPVSLMNGADKSLACL